MLYNISCSNVLKYLILLIEMHWKRVQLTLFLRVIALFLQSEWERQLINHTDASIHNRLVWRHVTPHSICSFRAKIRMKSTTTDLPVQEGDRRNVDKGIVSFIDYIVNNIRDKIASNRAALKHVFDENIFYVLSWELVII